VHIFSAPRKTELKRRSELRFENAVPWAKRRSGTEAPFCLQTVKAKIRNGVLPGTGLEQKLRHGTAF